MDNREILFRAKHVHAVNKNEHLNGTWVYGYLSDKNYINSFEEDEYGGKYACDMLIDPETVCQYTGKTDGDGKKVFEGDIVRNFLCIDDHGDKLYEQGVVKYDEETFGFSVFDNENNRYRISHMGNIEVIGNVFDNPELLGAD